MPTEKQIDAATDAYLKARGWSDDTIKANFLTRAEVLRGWDGSCPEGGGRGGRCPKRGLN
jgi:hypothetical protein